MENKMPEVTQHYVEFLSPGTFVSEVTMREIHEWDVDRAVEMAGEIVERHAARPYGFRFVTRGRNIDEMDSHTIKGSGIYYLGGTVRTAEEVLSGTDPDEEILRMNIRINNYKAIVENTNSWRFTAPLDEEDQVLDVVLPSLSDQPEND